jgi:GTPase SAR1 family protein
MNIDDIKYEIIEFAKVYNMLNNKTYKEYLFAKIIEDEVISLIYNYCQSNDSIINDSSPKKIKKLDNSKSQHDDSFNKEIQRLYIQLLSLEKQEIADLFWFYKSQFWPLWFDDRNKFIEQIRCEIINGFFTKKF